MFPPSSTYTQYPIMTEIGHLHTVSIQTLYSVLCWSTFCSDYSLESSWGMMLQDWHTCIWGVTPIFICRSYQALSSWMGSVLHSYFQVSPKMFDRVQVRALAGLLRDIQRLVPKPLLHCLGWVLRVVVLLGGEPSHQSVVLSALEQVFMKYRFTLLRSSFPPSCLVSQSLLLNNIPPAWCCHHRASL